MESRTLTITLNAENAAALKFWTGESAEQIMNLVFEEFMEVRGEDVLRDIARDPKKRAKVYRRNKLSKKEITKWNRGIEAELEQNRAEVARIHAPVILGAFNSRVTDAGRISASGLGIKLD
jgi:hypothetical protein